MPGIAVLLILTETAVLIFGGYTAARYVLQKTEKTVAEASEFYFTSDLLRETPKELPNYYVDPQNKDFQIALYNSVDSLRVTSADIEYEVVVQNGKAEKVKGTIRGGKANTENIRIIPGEGEERVTVTVKTTQPYSKSLSATFTLALGNQYSIEDEAGNIAAVLTMNCTDDSKAVKLSLPDGIIPDNTDKRVSKTEDGYTFQSSGHEIYSLVLLKSNSDKNMSKASESFADSINIDV